MATAADSTPAQTASNAVLAPSTIVLGTAELLESIILHMSLSGILRSQQLCKSWQACIKDSIKLQRALFLQPFNDDRSILNCQRWTGEGFPAGGDQIIPEGFISKKTKSSIRPFLNPMLRQLAFSVYRFGGFVSIFHNGIIAPQLDTRDYSEPHFLNGHVTGVEDYGADNMWRLRALHSPGASWLNMYVMQPPCARCCTWSATTTKQFGSRLSTQAESLCAI